MTYRVLAKRDEHIDPKRPMYGLIVVPKHLQKKKPRPHRCHLPGLLRHLWQFIIFKPIEVGSLFRCTCKRIYIYAERQGINKTYFDWELDRSSFYSFPSQWKNFGGNVEENDNWKADKYDGANT